MRKNKAMKVALFVTSTALFLSIPSTIARADDFITAEQGVAGIAELLDSTTPEEVADAYNATIQTEENLSPYANLGVSIADNYVNIRKEASTESEVVGKLYRGCAADILETLEGDWVKIKSGDVEGYIASNFLAIGDDAEAMVDEYAEKYATVNTETLRVREKKSTDSSILTLIPGGEVYPVKKEYKDWVELILGSDDETGGDFTGFVKKDYVTIEVKFKYAISIEEENRLKKEQEDREKAKAEREAAQKEAERKEQERLAAQAQAEAEANANANDSKEEETKNETPSNSGDSSSNSSLRQQVVEYALKFVGNPYVWGGESLTNGADCSGFVQAVYADFGYYLPRVSRSQASAGKSVSESDLLPGDLLFYGTSSGYINHVAMYIGNGKIVHAANSRQGIITSQYKYRNIVCARRIIY
jgi:peptidoglycan DL-endopeptidase CwlO